ncbi:MAG: hypothetical protein LBU39_02635 [Desulfobulbaceae bacterium]|nr:hypothetical protein [Desulfobulbaceae bacterium]
MNTVARRIKLMTRAIPPGHDARRWSRQLPGAENRWRDSEFFFNPLAEEYDWLVVYHDLPKTHGWLGLEKLRCDPRKTLLITSEPSSITVYGRDYLRQFGIILTFQEPWAMPHPQVVFSQPGLIWYYGYPLGDGHIRDYDELSSMEAPEKTRQVSTICSIRQGRVTLHHQRFDFTEHLRQAIPELEVFGHGRRPINDKAEVIDPYRYHLTIENHYYPHHLTEKLPDIFLGYAVPFFYGCPNAEDYFPKESFIRININDLKKTTDIIRSTIANNEYHDRLPYVREARRRALEEYNLFAVIDRLASDYENRDIPQPKNGRIIMNRPTLRLKHPMSGLRNFAEQMAIKSLHISKRLAGGV